MGISPKRPYSSQCSISRLCETLDSVPHERLLLKADYYGIRNKANIWLRSFLTGRSQRVVVDHGSAFSWSPVVSRVPQGTLVGPSFL